MKKFVLTLIVGLMSVMGLCAPKNSPWREIQSVIIPQSTEIHEGLTRSGNAKFWIKVEEVNVSISPANASKFKAGEVQLELVKWYNDSTGKYRYSTRQVKISAPTREEKNIDLSKVFR